MVGQSLFLPEFLDSVAEMVMEFPKPMVSWNFNIPCLGPESEIAQEFMAYMVTMDLIQFIKGHEMIQETPRVLWEENKGQS